MTPWMRSTLLPGIFGLAALTLAVLAGSLALLQAPLQDLTLLGLFLLASGGAALTVGYLAVYLGDFPFLHSVRLRLLVVPLVVVVVAIANTWFIAQLMFISAHDLALLALVLLFSLGLSAFLTYLLSESLRTSIQRLAVGVQRMIGGDLQTRVEVGGKGELSELAEAFNVMAARIEDAFKRQQALEQARREMFVAVSHDLRTPVASIRAIVESINDGVVTDPETVRRYLQTLEHEVGELSVLIDDLFELTQIDTGVLQLHLERASLHDLISDALESMSAQAHQSGLSLQGHVEDETLTVLVDASRVHRVLFNLVQNAIRHTSADGAVSIQASDQGQEVQVDVIDTGEGIAPEDAEKVFERFYRGDKARTLSAAGSGLGLSIAKAIVEAHGGRIWVKSAPGQGATFTFTLPKH